MFNLKVSAHVGLVRILKSEGVDWISVFPSSGINTPCGDEGVNNVMLRDERFAVAVADGFSRVSNRKQFGVCTVQGGFNSAGVQYAYGALAQAYEDSTHLFLACLYFKSLVYLVSAFLGCAFGDDLEELVLLPQKIGDCNHR